MSYIEELEKQNEELRKMLAESQKKVIEKNVDNERRLPKWFNCEGSNYYYGWECRNIASVALTTDKRFPWHIWLCGEEPSNDPGSLRKFKSLEDAKTVIEIIYSNASVTNNE